MSPGELILHQDREPLDGVELTADWKTEVLTTTGEDESATRTYLVESKLPIRKVDPETGFSVLPLASIPSAVRHFSIVRLEPYWLGPRHGKGNFFFVGEDAIVTSFLLDSGLIVTFVVVGWIDDVYQVLRGTEQGMIAVAAQNDNSDDRNYKVVMSVGLDYQETVQSALEQVRDIVISSAKLKDLHASAKQVLSTIDSRAASVANAEWLDNLAFCTWNALGQDLTQDKILMALAELKKHDIRISTLLIDDNWQTLGPTKYDFSDPFYRGWSAMEANTDVAPNGLKDLISSIRSQYPEIKDIGIWHALMGYWGGISQSGSIASQYPTTDISALLMGNKVSTVTTISAETLHRFYHDFYTFLKSCGLTFVKTDVQHMVSTYQDPPTRRALISTYQSAWTSAHLAHFGGKAISCMSEVPQILFHSLMQTDMPAILMRNSDDFYPEVPASHPWHIWTNAHNAHFTRHLNVVPDWDMFQTSHEFSAYHAAARCVSGGPILITDVPGQHDVRLIKEMTATSPDGRCVALRTGKGVSKDVFTLYSEGNALKVVARTGSADDGSDSVLMAIFNTGEKEIRFMVDMGEFGIQRGWRHGHANGHTEVLVRGHRTGEIFGPVDLGQSTGVAQVKRLIHARLPVKGYDILTVQPVLRIESATGRRRVCALGLMGKMSGAAAIATTSVTSLNDGKVKVVVHLQALGKLGIWFDDGQDAAAVEVSVQGSKVDETFYELASRSETRHGNAGEVSKRPHVMVVDVEGWWTSKNMWTNTCKNISVEITLN